MNKLHITKVSVTLDLKVPASIIEKHMPASPYVVGEQIAEHVLDHVNKEKLGYFPALDYFRGKDDVMDEDLLDAADNITWAVSNMVREEITIKLRPFFSHISVESIQSQAFKLPNIRMHTFNLEHKLANYYTPDHFRVALVLSSVRNHDDNDSAETIAINQVTKWLKDEFSGLKVTSAKILNNEKEKD